MWCITLMNDDHGRWVQLTHTHTHSVSEVTLAVQRCRESRVVQRSRDSFRSFIRRHPGDAVLGLIRRKLPAQLIHQNIRLQTHHRYINTVCLIMNHRRYHPVRLINHNSFKNSQKTWSRLSQTTLLKLLGFALFNIKKIRPFLSEHASQLLVQALVLSRLDYCNALFQPVLSNLYN